MDVVYFIRQVGTPFVKVGWTSSDPAARLSGLQTANPTELALERVVVGHGRETERMLHRKWRSRLVRGEWYRLSDAEVASPTFEPVDPPSAAPWVVHHLARYAQRVEVGANTVAQCAEGTGTHQAVVDAAKNLARAARALDAAVGAHCVGEVSELRERAAATMVRMGLLQRGEG